MKNINYHYKQVSLNIFNQETHNRLDSINEYGYNFGFDSKRLDNEDMRFLKTKNIVNKAIINTKR